MTTATTSTLAINQATDNELLESYEDALASLEGYKHLVGKLQMEIYHRIEARGGTSLPNADENGEQIWVCERVDTHDYDKSLFLPLLEKFAKYELDECYIEAHDEPVPAKRKAAGTVMKVAKAHGDGAVEIVERARIPKSSRIKFNRINREAADDGTGADE